MSAALGHARLDRADAVVVERHQQRVEDEARLVLRLAPAAARPSRIHAQAVLNVSSDVFMPGDISISFISCAGRQKCMPTTRSSRPEPPAISVIDSVEVLDAKIVVPPADLVQLAEQLVLDAPDPRTPPRSPDRAWPGPPATSCRDSRAITASLVGGAHLAALDRLAEEALGLPRARAPAPAWRRRSRWSSNPARAATMAMPAPMVPPAPQTRDGLDRCSFASRSSVRSAGDGPGWCLPRSA